MSGVDVRVSKRLLWVGGACYPLRNIARVYTFTLQPRRKDAVVRCLKRFAFTLLTAIGLSLIAAMSRFDSDGEGYLDLIWFFTVAFLVYAVGDMISVLVAKSHFVLAVETSGPSTALVTAQNPAHLHELVRSLADAIENPEREFTVHVQTLAINPSNYYFGDNVNMYGGNGNTGVSNS
ncbi:MULTISPECIES: DUF6232 family protein [Streptomyces]|uniref:DUF6232 family protein n=1 Tax=Streptomyces TaxID=1883 RepID=UPI001319A69C|nr:MULTISPECIES: DUF6232 family protein [Streptomyces]QGZ52968.1 hypothetical protein GPZ77_16165 [Streptomyces sp. QHH-9511]GGT69789.1 hypothetical protein GCM10010272_11100 [Streptomyces lateritius]